MILDDFVIIQNLHHSDKKDVAWWFVLYDGPVALVVLQLQVGQ